MARQRRRWGLMLRAAYDSRRRRVASAVLERSGRWLDTARAFVAAAFLWAQNKALGQLLVAAQQRPPSFTLLRLAWDETGQQMTLKIQRHRAGDASHAAAPGPRGCVGAKNLELQSLCTAAACPWRVC